ncbi:Uncharacterized protein AXF42_Ash007874 [Apostasia shenzhenica]|uniref:Late embryogenesis abundant protein LEA-2 subgroup domain-containing protein n=1 Tax=Apostasia shenzhenica TaxID=1088818 RepID=A0A2I0B5L0_9ASPA|nr:Uncharacterized protein AXF42_Ash007874 [Apostasia shenzhenica]
MAMSDLVHPQPPPQPPQPPPTEEKRPDFSRDSAANTPSDSYVIQFPKDHIYRVPPPENEYRSKAYARRAARQKRRTCCRCLAWTAGAFAVLALALASAAAVLYLVFQPKIPNYSIDSIAVRGLNLSSNTADRPLSPELDVAIRADNPNKKIAIYYRDGSSVAAAFADAVLCRGAWPVFYQGKRNVTVFITALKGSGIRLSGATRKSLTAAVNRGAVPLDFRVEVPVRVKFGAVTSWTVTVKARCDVTLDKLTADASVLSKKCKVHVDFF